MWWIVVLVVVVAVVVFNKMSVEAADQHDVRMFNVLFTYF